MDENGRIIHERLRRLERRGAWHRCLTIAFAVLLALAPMVSAPFVEPVPEAFAKASKTVIMKTASGAAQQVTTNTTIATRKITFQSKVGNAATVYVGLSTVSSSVFLASLAPGQGYTITVSTFEASMGESLLLSEYYVLGTNPDLISISYEVIS